VSQGGASLHDSSPLVSATNQWQPTKPAHTDFVPNVNIDELGKKVIPIDEVIEVDLYLPGCQPHPHFIFESLSTLVEKREPKTGQETVCGGCSRVMKRTEVTGAPR
jgi:F420-non-reducing hydrogenase small subunit